MAKLPQRIALLGNPNCGKTALFNLLTGSRQKVANYAGVTVERKEGLLQTPSGRTVSVLDLPGTYSLFATSDDERVTRDVVLGLRPEPRPDLLVCVTDATNLRLSLQLVVQARHLGLPMVVVLNMTDMLQKTSIHIDIAKLQQELGVPVIEAIAIRRQGAEALLALLDQPLPPAPEVEIRTDWSLSTQADTITRQTEVQRLFAATVQMPPNKLGHTDTIDRVVLHPVVGPLLLAVILFVMFQAVFSWAHTPMDIITGLTESAGAWVTAHMADGPLRSLLVDGVIAGAGGVLVFLPQIIILFLFILALEDSGYLPRAAFLLDRVMGSVGLSGRSFIPLLSSFACAVPGIMATRTISNWRDRLVTIMIAPLMTCSARLPVYALLIAAFIPQQDVAGIFNLQGLVLFGLYVFGIVSAMMVAWVGTRWRGPKDFSPLLLELPAYRFPNVRNLLLGLLERAWIFIRRVGTIIVTVTILLWFLSSFPAAPEGADQAAIYYSLAGRFGMWMEPLFAPLGFNWQMVIALVPGMAAREVVVGALGTVYALSAQGEEVATALGALLANQWSMATAMSFLVWFVFAPQCISTLAIVRRETQSWRWATLMATYLFALAYVASFITYRVVLALSA